MPFFLFLISFLLLFATPSNAQEIPISEEEMIHVVNSSFGNTPLYQSKDIPNEDLHSFDFNDDGKAEWVVIPKNACGITHTCHVFILQQNKSKKNSWQLLLLASGKITSLTPWGFLTLPHKTKGYVDFAMVFDQGHDGQGNRLFDRRIYVWNGKQYEEWTSLYPPPGTKGEEIQKRLEQLNSLKSSHKKPSRG